MNRRLIAGALAIAVLAVLGCAKSTVGGWRLTVKNARVEEELTESELGFGSGTYRPDPGMRFLVVETELEKRGPTQSKLLSEEIVAVGTDGSRYPAAGVNPGAAWLMGGFSAELIEGNELLLAFVVPEAMSSEEFRLLFKEVEVGVVVATRP
jgi:hypothetical protein